MTLKKNQPELFEDVKFYFDNTKLESFATVEKNYGRIEKRICRKMADTQWLKKRHDWIGLKSVFAGRENNFHAEKTTQVCEHRKIENMHWILDAVFGEDDCDSHSDKHTSQ